MRHGAYPIKAFPFLRSHVFVQGSVETHLKASSALEVAAPATKKTSIYENLPGPSNVVPFRVWYGFW